MFLHEHPATATSWNEPSILEVLQHSGVSRINADQCQLGQEARNGEPIKKPTGFMSNCPDILAQLHRRCSGRGGACSRAKGGTHQLCHGKEARRAAIFQRDLCEAILIGLKRHMQRHRRMGENEQFYLSGCGIMVDGDDDVSLHVRESGFDPVDDTGRPMEAAAFFADDNARRRVATSGCGSKLGWAPLADDGSPGGGTPHDATRHPPMPKSDFGSSDCLDLGVLKVCLLYTSPSPRDRTRSRMPSSA